MQSVDIYYAPLYMFYMLFSKKTKDKRVEVEYKHVSFCLCVFLEVLLLLLHSEVYPQNTVYTIHVPSNRG